MAKENTVVTPQESGLVGAPIPVGGMSPEQFQQFLALMMAQSAQRSAITESEELDLEEKRLRKAERDRKINERKRAQETQAVEIKAKAEERQLYQDVLCGHKKPNGSPMLGGQRLSNGDMYLFCLFEKCGKQWINGKDKNGMPMPHDLHMDNRLIGGAVIEGGTLD